MLISTFFRNLKSFAGSVPMITGVVARLSLATDAAREIESGGAAVEALGVGAFEIDGVRALCVGFDVIGEMGIEGVAIGPLFPASAEALLTPTMRVSSFLNFSRSGRAFWDVKVKLWPVSSVNSAIFSLTWAAPSLLQNKAGGDMSREAETMRHWRLTGQLSARKTYRGGLSAFLCPLEVRICEL